MVLAAVKQHGGALQHAGQQLSGDIDVVREAVQQDPGALRFAAPELVQHKMFLKIAGVLPQYAQTLGKPLLIESVRFALGRESSPSSTVLHNYLNQHKFFRKFTLYNPNAYDKGFCARSPDGSIDWDRATDKNWKCRGLQSGPAKCDLPGTCGGQADACICEPNNTACVRPTLRSCWRYSFRWHQEEAQRTKGFMLQVIERGELGAGQQIEEEMAMDVGLLVVKFAIGDEFDPERHKRSFDNLADIVSSHGLGVLR